MYSATTDDDVRLTRYRLQVVERMPDSPLKRVLLDALHDRLRRICPSRGPEATREVPRAA
jgi:hypothetical protein